MHTCPGGLRPHTQPVSRSQPLTPAASGTIGLSGLWGGSDDGTNWQLSHRPGVIDVQPVADPMAMHAAAHARLQAAMLTPSGQDEQFRWAARTLGPPQSPGLSNLLGLRDSPEPQAPLAGRLAAGCWTLAGPWPAAADVQLLCT